MRTSPGVCGVKGSTLPVSVLCSRISVTSFACGRSGAFFSSDMEPLIVADAGARWLANGAFAVFTSMAAKKFVFWRRAGHKTNPVCIESPAIAPTAPTLHGQGRLCYRRTSRFSEESGHEALSLWCPFCPGQYTGVVPAGAGNGCVAAIGGGRGRKSADRGDGGDPALDFGSGAISGREPAGLCGDGAAVRRRPCAAHLGLRQAQR